MIDKQEFHQFLLLTFFAFLGGLTRELNDLISNKVNFKNFIIGVVTAITTGVIFGKFLTGTHVSEDLACGLAGLSGFLGPHLLYMLSAGLEKKLSQYLEVDIDKIQKK